MTSASNAKAFIYGAVFMLLVSDNANYVHAILASVSIEAMSVITNIFIRNFRRSATLNSI